MRDWFLVLWPYALVVMIFTLAGYLRGWHDCERSHRNDSQCGAPPP